MEIVNIRIDERLIHGQVAAMWTGSLKASRIMVVDNEVVKNDFQKRMLKMACPQNIKLSILDTATAANNVGIQKYGDDRIFVIVKGPETLVDLIGCGFPVKTVTVGNMSSGPDTRQISKTINITAEDEKAFNSLHSRNVQLYAQMIPSAEKQDFISMLHK